MFAVCLVALAVLALLGARGLPDWVNRKGDAPILLSLYDTVQAWDDRLDRWGLNRPHDALRAWTRDIEARRF